MDEYYIFIRRTNVDDKIVNETIKVLQTKANSWKRDPIPDTQLVNIHQILRCRDKKIFVCHLVINDEEESTEFTWCNIKDDDVTPAKGSYSSIAESVMQHSDELPLPGSCLISTVWFVESDNWNSLDDLKNAIPLLGCLRKLNLWHNGHFTLVCDKKNKHVMNIADFVTDIPHVVSETEYINNILSEIGKEGVWSGNLNLFSEGKSICEINNVKLAMEACSTTIKTEVAEVDSSPDENEECFIWFQNSITVIEIIDVNSVPFYLFSGQKFTLFVYSSEDDTNALNQLIANMSEIENSCLFCSIEYASLPTHFPPSSLISYAEWKDCASNHPEKLNARLLKPECSSSVVHFILTTNPDSKTLTMQLLHPLDTFFQLLFMSTDFKSIFPEKNNALTNFSDNSPELIALKNLSANDNRMDRLSAATDNVRKKSKEVGMFFQCKDVLKVFNKSGKPKGKCTYLSQPSPHETPDKKKLRDFKYALGNKHHGLAFNQDIENSETKDRESRRLINQFVKFETASLSSIDKITLPSLFVEDSPGKQKPSTSARRSNDMKQKKLQEVAEKLYRKRLQSRSQSTSNMVLRSTPKKGVPRRESLREISSTQNRKDSTTTNKSLQDRHRNNKQMLQNVITKTLVKHGITANHPSYTKCCRKLYDVSMMFLKDLKSCKGLQAVINKTVEENVKTVLTFFHIESKS